MPSAVAADDVGRPRGEAADRVVVRTVDELHLVAAKASARAAAVPVTSVLM